MKIINISSDINIELLNDLINSIPGLKCKICEQVNEKAVFISIKDNKNRECFSSYFRQIKTSPLESNGGNM